MLLCPRGWRQPLTHWSSAAVLRQQPEQRDVHMRVGCRPSALWAALKAVGMRSVAALTVCVAAANVDRPLAGAIELREAHRALQQFCVHSTQEANSAWLVAMRQVIVRHGRERRTVQCNLARCLYLASLAGHCSLAVGHSRYLPEAVHSFGKVRTTKVFCFFPYEASS
jgi:hypothetical protein